MTSTARPQLKAAAVFLWARLRSRCSKTSKLYGCSGCERDLIKMKTMLAVTRISSIRESRRPAPRWDHTRSVRFAITRKNSLQGEFRSKSGNRNSLQLLGQHFLFICEFVQDAHSNIDDFLVDLSIAGDCLSQWDRNNFVAA